VNRDARGFSLIEIVLAMTLFAVVITGLAGVMFQFLRTAREANSRSAIMATMTEQAGRLLAVSYDSLTSKAGCTHQTQPIDHQRCIAVSTLGPNWKQVTLILTPSDSTLKPDTVVFQRSKTAKGPIH
jgi:prepilin-type N-terminal cleavage/methylation domain-containing protein